jgi:hypothetical protein
MIIDGVIMLAFSVAALVDHALEGRKRPWSYPPFLLAIWVFLAAMGALTLGYGAWHHNWISNSDTTDP